MRVADDAPGGPFGVPWKRGLYAVVGAVPGFEGLLYGEARGRVTPLLTSRWEIAADRRAVISHLRRGVGFHDNRELTAEVVRFNLQRQIEERLLPRMIQSAEVLDRYTVRVHLSEWHNGLLVYFGGLGAADLASALRSRGSGRNGQSGSPCGPGRSAFSGTTQTHTPCMRHSRGTGIGGNPIWTGWSCTSSGSSRR